jgi:hypothetical protein
LRSFQIVIFGDRLLSCSVAHSIVMLFDLEPGAVRWSRVKVPVKVENDRTTAVAAIDQPRLNYFACFQITSNHISTWGTASERSGIAISGEGWPDDKAVRY